MRRRSSEYVPGHGDPTYAVKHYDLALDYKLDGNQLTAKATLSAVALESIISIGLDLYGLRVAKVSVDGARPARYAVRNRKLVIEFASPRAAGEEFAVVVSYHGRPRPMPGIDGEAGWEELSDGVIVASQPHGAPSWFPCNDRPGNKATYRFQVTTPSAYRVVTNGTLADSRRRSSRTTWVYEQAEPMATYLATVQIGRYQVRTTETASVPLHTAYPARLAAAADRAFTRHEDMLELFTRLFGPYPFTDYTVVVTDDELEIPLEAQALSIFGANHLSTDWESARLVAHELAHQWFGNSLTVKHWRDIWLHEGFACYCEWLWSQESGGRPAAQHAARHWERLSGLPRDLVLGEPGPERMFDDRIYKRGALLLHALRTSVGDDLFFGLLREWVARNAYGSVTTSMFVDLAEEIAGRPLGDFFGRWLYEPELPALPDPRSADQNRRSAD